MTRARAVRDSREPSHTVCVGLLLSTFQSLTRALPTQQELTGKGPLEMGPVQEGQGAAGPDFSQQHSMVGGWQEDTLIGYAPCVKA